MCVCLPAHFEYNRFCGPSTVTPLSLISNIKSKRTSALKTNTNRTCYVTPLYAWKNTSHVPTIPFFKLKVSRKNGNFDLHRDSSPFSLPLLEKENLNKIHPARNKTVESNLVTGGTAVPCTVRITANCCGWIIAISANYGGAGLFFPASWAQRRSDSDECHGQPTPPPTRGMYPH